MMMSDKLTEALEKAVRYGVLDPGSPIMTAAQWAASFPTVKDVERAAKAARQWQHEQGFVVADPADLIPEMRAVLEAVKVEDR